MKKKLAEFLMVEETDLKVLAILTIVSALLTPLVYKIIFAPMGWWL